MTPLEKKYETLRTKMLKAQSDYTQAVRKGIVGDAALRKLADKGFKLEKEVFEMMERVEKERAMVGKVKKPMGQAKAKPVAKPTGQAKTKPKK